MIPLSDIQRTSVRGTALCLAVSAADPDCMCFKGNQSRAEFFSIKLLFIKGSKMETHEILPLTHIWQVLEKHSLLHILSKSFTLHTGYVK